MNTKARAAGLLFSGALLLSVSAFPMGEHAMPNKITAAQSAAAANLRQDMRKLWTDHVVWTRDYIIAAVADQPDAQAAANRL